MDDDTLPITPVSLQPLIGSARCPIIVDVRRKAAYDEAERVIATARRRDHRDAAEWAEEVPTDAAVVVYCIHGHEVSQSAAALLRACGRRARFLEGGFEDFAAAGGITVIKGGSSGTWTAPGSRWAIDATATIDRAACLWLVRRFIDPQALFLAVAPERLEAVAKEAEAVLCEAGSADSTPAADGSRFEALLSRFGLSDPTLLELARIVRDAGAIANATTPEAAGLRAISLGLASGRGAAAPDEDGDLVIYDALFAHLRASGGRR